MVALLCHETSKRLKALADYSKRLFHGASEDDRQKDGDQDLWIMACHFFSAAGAAAFPTRKVQRVSTFFSSAFALRITV